MAFRKVLITVVGHVDHGKTTLLDRIRNSSVAEREAGLITQAIGASIVPLETIRRVCGPLLDQIRLDVKLPGILAIDTPGHAAFSNLRKRGGSLADIAIVVVDINEGFMPQTEESIDILKAHKTPFIIAANKIDLIPGWHEHPDLPLFAHIAAQPPNVQEIFERKMYELVGKLSEKFNLNCERFDRVEDYTQQIAIVPIAAKKSYGLPELLVVIIGLAQKFLEKSLNLNVEGPAKGTVLEIKEDKGLGKTLDVIIYDGSLRVNDTIVIGGVEAPIVTKVKALFEPAALSEMREKRTKFVAAKEVSAATGVKISAKDIDNVIAGMPMEAVHDSQTLEKVKSRVQAQVGEVMIETDTTGVVVKAESLGSLEALITLLREKSIPIKKALIGNITKKDINDAHAVAQEDPLLGCVIGFNVDLQQDVQPGSVKILLNNVIYKLIEDLEKWQAESKKRIETSQLDILTRPFKIELLRGYVFRQSNPAVVGISVEAGTVRTGVQVMKADGKPISVVKGIQREKENVDKAERGAQVAVSLPNVIVGRQINEGDILYSYIPEEDFVKLKDFKEFLSEDEKEVLRDIANMMRKDNPVWGI
ncbi:translation initiation factor IF-2 [Candidatus Woesearchaeota archaeon]|nr:translation initiation factor IF-2 [Candidatus Woesearchaeota archaeon]